MLKMQLKSKDDMIEKLFKENQTIKHKYEKLKSYVLTNQPEVQNNGSESRKYQKHNIEEEK